LCKFLCKNIWVAAPPYSEGLAFLGTPHPLPCVVIRYRECMDSSFSLQRARNREVVVRARSLWGALDLSTGHSTRG
jgi:hypothetical protein